MLRKGDCDGRRLLDPKWVEVCTSYAGTPLPKRSAADPAPASGLCWWVNHDGVWKTVPRDAFCGAGAGHQIVLVIPSIDMIIVRNGGAMGAKNETFWGAAEKHLFTPLMSAVSDGAGAK